MPKETEKRWLVSGSAWRDLVYQEPALLTQGYVAMGFGNTVRVRLSEGPREKHGSIECKGNRDFLTVDDESIAVPVIEANRWLDLFCKERTLKKLRYRLLFSGQTYEVDVFQGKLEPLVIAEAELTRADTALTVPSWCTDDISHEVAYSNFNLATKGLPKSYAAWLRSQPSY